MERSTIRKYKIRKEEVSDFREIDSVIKEAFYKKTNTNVEERFIVQRLRKSAEYIPALSLVAEADNKIIGHIMFSRAYIGNDVVLCLAPLSVAPLFQKQGVGTALVNEGHKRAQALGYKYSVVLGDPMYYQRFGFELASKFGIQAPETIPPQFLQALKLSEDTPILNGVISYSKAFGI